MRVGARITKIEREIERSCGGVEVDFFCGRFFRFAIGVAERLVVVSVSCGKKKSEKLSQSLENSGER